MAEALCGPSNPLQQFKQQTQVNRTLQQDRLATRQQQSSGFRTVYRNAHQADAEFEAFQAGAPMPELQRFQPQHDLPLASPAPFATQQLPSWAADFQRLHVSGPAPVQQHFMPQPAASNWATDFRQHIAQPAPRAQSSSPSPWAFQQRARYGLSGFDSYAQSSLTERPLSKGKAAVREDFDEAAFARAFDMVEQELEPHFDEAVYMEETTQHQDIFENSEAMEDVIERALKDSIFDPETVLGNVAIDEPDSFAAMDMDYNGAGLMEAASFVQQEEPLLQQQEEEEAATTKDARAEDDALAATAGELLDRVKDNQSDKFQNSMFLELMRKLKDREVKVDGDKMVETVGSTSIPYIPKRHLSPDSGYGSAPSTPPPMQEPIIPDMADRVNTAADCDVLEAHRWDHWESPYT